jgi:hypothetical protein
MRKCKGNILLFMLLWIMFYGFGCQSAQERNRGELALRREGAAPGVRVDDARQPYAKIRYNSVGILDKSLQDWSYPRKKFLFWEVEEDERNVGKIAVESTNSRRTATGTLEAWAVIRNRTNNPLQIEGRTTYFDKDKVPCEEPTAWQRLFLQPNSVGTYKDFSTKVHEVNYYYIEIREGR